MRVTICFCVQVLEFENMEVVLQLISVCDLWLIKRYALFNLCERFAFFDLFPVVVNCTNPGSIKNGNQDGNSNYSFGSTVRFSCNQGFQLNGSGLLLCSSSGVWNSSNPQCLGKGIGLVWLRVVSF